MPQPTFVAVRLLFLEYVSVTLCPGLTSLDTLNEEINDYTLSDSTEWDNAVSTGTGQPAGCVDAARTSSTRNDGLLTSAVTVKKQRRHSFYLKKVPFRDASLDDEEARDTSSAIFCDREERTSIRSVLTTTSSGVAVFGNRLQRYGSLKVRRSATVLKKFIDDTQVRSRTTFCNMKRKKCARQNCVRVAYSITI